MMKKTVKQILTIVCELIWAIPVAIIIILLLPVSILFDMLDGRYK